MLIDKLTDKHMDRLQPNTYTTNWYNDFKWHGSKGFPLESGQ